MANLPDEKESEELFIRLMKKNHKCINMEGGIITKWCHYEPCRRLPLYHPRPRAPITSQLLSQNDEDANEDFAAMYHTLKDVSIYTFGSDNSDDEFVQAQEEDSELNNTCYEADPIGAQLQAKSHTYAQ